MEWSRHDRAIITVAAYVIGFATAYIAFGVDISPHTKIEHYSNPAQHYVQSDSRTQGHIVSAVIEGDGLRVTFANGERLLSARNLKAESQVASVIASSGTSGIHHAIVDAEISRNNKFVYFCEQLTVNAETCDPYIYEVEKDVLHHVTLNGEVFSPQIENHTSSWSPAGALAVDFNLSKNTEEPWSLYFQ